MKQKYHIEAGSHLGRSIVKYVALVNVLLSVIDSITTTYCSKQLRMHLQSFSSGNGLNPRNSSCLVTSPLCPRKHTPLFPFTSGHMPESELMAFSVSSARHCSLASRNAMYLREIDTVRSCKKVVALFDFTVLFIS